jgi:hypothetical protein
MESRTINYALSEAAMQLEIDHITVCGSDLDAMRRAFADVGLKTAYGGPHANGVTHMDLLAFEDGSYLELIAPMHSLDRSSGMMAGWAELMNGNAGAGAWAVRCYDIQAEVNRLRAIGLVHGPEAGSRKRPDGTVLEWQTAILGPGRAGSVLPFLIEDKTPRDLRVPTAEFSNGLRGVTSVLIGVHDLEASTDIFQRAFEWDSPNVERSSDFGATIAHFPGAPVMLAAPLQADSWLSQRLERLGECPAAFLLASSDHSEFTQQFALAGDSCWFGRKICWFDKTRLRGVRLGLME